MAVLTELIIEAAWVNGNKKLADWKLGIRSLNVKAYCEINTIESNDWENYEFILLIISPVPNVEEHFK